MGRMFSAALLALSSQAPCSSPLDGGADGPPRGTIEIAREGSVLATFEVELALTPADQAQGLMNRESLPRDEGMAFLFSTPVRQPFYMLHTLIPLDIAFWDEGGVIIDIFTMTPCTAEPCETYAPARDYIGALEVNAGVFEERGVRPGDRVQMQEG